MIFLYFNGPALQQAVLDKSDSDDDNEHSHHVDFALKESEIHSDIRSARRGINASFLNSKAKLLQHLKSQFLFGRE